MKPSVAASFQRPMRAMATNAAGGDSYGEAASPRSYSQYAVYKVWKLVICEVFNLALVSDTDIRMSGIMCGGVEL